LPCERMVEADLAKLVDHHRRVRHRRRAQRTIEQRGFAAAQKTGQNSDWCVRQALP